MLTESSIVKDHLFRFQNISTEYTETLLPNKPHDDTLYMNMRVTQFISEQRFLYKAVCESLEGVACVCTYIYWANLPA